MQVCCGVAVVLPQYRIGLPEYNEGCYRNVHMEASLGAVSSCCSCLSCFMECTQVQHSYASMQTFDSSMEENLDSTSRNFSFARLR